MKFPLSTLKPEVDLGEREHGIQEAPVAAAARQRSGPGDRLVDNVLRIVQNNPRIHLLFHAFCLCVWKGEKSAKNVLAD